jgi:hypothetical protein
MARITGWDGISRTPFGYLVPVSVSPFPRRTKRSPAGTKHDELIRWRTATRQALERWRPRAAQAGIVGADVTRFQARWGTGKHPHAVAQRARHLRLFAQVFGSRLRATLMTQEIEAQLGAWQRDELPLSEFATKRSLSATLASRAFCPRPVSLRSGLEARRDALVSVIDRRPELLHTHDAGERDKRDQQGVLDQVLALVFVDETMNQRLRHCVRSPFGTSASACVSLRSPRALSTHCSATCREYPVSRIIQMA